jgi:dihydroorotase-like cyclic amidohydrolase
MPSLKVANSSKHDFPDTDADISLVDLNHERTVQHQELLSCFDYSLYDGWTFRLAD